MLAAAVLLMFVTSVRQSNLLPSSQRTFDPTRQLVWADVSWPQSYIKVNIKWGKAKQKSITKFQKIPQAKSSHLCTVNALIRLKQQRRNMKPSAPLISFPDGKPVPVSYVNKKWKQAMVLPFILLVEEEPGTYKTGARRQPRSPAMLDGNLARCSIISEPPVHNPPILRTNI